MKASEKLDLILKELYQYGCNSDHYSLIKAVQSAMIPLSQYDDLRSFAKKLVQDELISLKDLEFDLTARITLEGMSFCEHTSYAYRGYPIITYLSIGGKNR